MRVEIDEEKKGKRNGLCSIHQHRDDLFPPSPPNQSSQGIRTSTFVSNPHFENHELLNNPHERKQKVENKVVVVQQDPSIQ